jgi:hypothetical protein
VDTRRHVVLGLEAAAHVAGADAQLQDGRHVGRFGQAEAFLHHARHHARSGRGSSRHMLDFSAKACVRSWITEAPSP